MFKRRDPLPWLVKLQTMVWPKSGWRRSWQYTMYRVGRLPGTGYAIAGGFAWGAAMSFTPLIGLHFLLSMAGAWLTRCSVVASIIGTVVGNPWTFPFIWIWLYKAGTAMGFGATGVDADAMDFAGLFGRVTESLIAGDWAYLADTALPILTPMLVAAVPSAAIVWVIFFLLLRPIVERYKNAVASRRAQRAAAVIEAVRQE